MLKAYVSLLPDIPYVPLLYPNLGQQHRQSILFLNHAFDFLRQPLVEIVEDPSRADVLLLAHNYSSIRHRLEYLRHYDRLARQLGKRIIVFAHGDSDEPVQLANATVFRTSLYRSIRRSNEIAMPAYAEDLLQDGSLSLRKKGEQPVVGFCGWAAYKNLRNRVGSCAWNTQVIFQSLAKGSDWRARKKGLTFRRKMLHVLRQSSCLRTHFIIRSSYSGHQQTIRIDPAVARREYVETFLDADLALAIKGDGNYSYRFYEALSLGRVPLFLDTDCVLPLEDHVPYDTFLLRLDWRQLREVPAIVAQWWDALTDEEFVRQQHAARDAFERYLRIDRFLAYAVDALM